MAAQQEYLTFAAVGALDAVATWTPGDPPAWKGTDYTAFYGMGDRVGEDRSIPGATGRLAVAREIDEMTVPLRMRFDGTLDRLGNVNADPFAGVMTSFLYFRKHVLDYTPARTVTLTKRGGGTSAASMIIDGYNFNVDPESAGDVILLVAQIVIPAGSLVTP